jgi:hypothetical protein
MRTVSEDEKEMLRELFPFVTIKEENHRLGTILEIKGGEESLRYRKSWAYEWAHAGKYAPCLFTLVFAGFTKNCEIIIDNYCNIVEEGDCKYDRGECTLVISDKKIIVEIYDLL